MKEARPFCSHFGSCGGCRFQDIPYMEQVREKERILEETLDVGIKVNPAPNPYRYRNRMDFVCSFGKSGLRRKGTFREVVELQECHLLSERSEKVFLKARDVVRKKGIPDYDYLEQEGYLRYIVIREAQNTGEIMLIFVTKNKKPLIEKAVKELEPVKDITSIVWSVNPTLSDTSFGDVEKTWKSPTITEKLGSISLKFGPNSFFQNNSAVSESLYSEIRKHVKGKTLDLYCGVGSIALFVADRAIRVMGVDSVGESIDFAKSNADKNKTKNAVFVQEEARKFLFTCRENGELFDTVICDPPREGLGPRVIKHLKKLSPKRIIMVSCNPKTLAQDLLNLLDSYEITQKKAFDMFPQTPHVEVMMVLERKHLKPEKDN